MEFEDTSCVYWSLTSFHLLLLSFLSSSFLFYILAISVSFFLFVFYVPLSPLPLFRYYFISNFSASSFSLFLYFSLSFLFPSHPHLYCFLPLSCAIYVFFFPIPSFSLYFLCSCLFPPVIFYLLSLFLTYLSYPPSPFFSHLLLIFLCLWPFLSLQSVDPVWTTPPSSPLDPPCLQVAGKVPVAAPLVAAALSVGVWDTTAAILPSPTPSTIWPSCRRPTSWPWNLRSTATAPWRGWVSWQGGETQWCGRSRKRVEI